MLWQLAILVAAANLVSGFNIDKVDQYTDERFAVANKDQCPSLCQCIPPPGRAYWFVICDQEDWGYSGVRPDPSVFCYGYDGINTTKIWLRFISSNVSTEDNAACSDPALRSRIMQIANRSWQSPQELADGLLFTLNRSGWLYIVAFGGDLDCAASHTPKDDNCCVVQATTANGISALIGSYRVM